MPIGFPWNARGTVSIPRFIKKPNTLGVPYSVKYDTLIRVMPWGTWNWLVLRTKRKALCSYANGCV